MNCLKGSLFKPDGTKYLDEVQYFSERMLSLRHTISSTVLLNSSSLKKWLTSTVKLIPKDIEQPKNHCLKFINTYDADYNFVFKYLWPNQGINEIEKNKWLELKQIGERKNTSVVKIAKINELIIEYHISTRQILCIHQDDAMGCYNRIVREHTILNNRKILIPDNICKLHSIDHTKIKF